MNTLLLPLALLLTPALALADDHQPSVTLKNVPAGEESTITIRKGAPGTTTAADPEYKIETGSEEIASEPVAGKKESYEAWKKACAEWKKDMREMNGKSLVSLSCGSPKAERDSSSLVTQTSTGSYKLRVKLVRPGETLAAPPKPNAE